MSPGGRWTPVAIGYAAVPGGVGAVRCGGSARSHGRFSGSAGGLFDALSRVPVHRRRNDSCCHRASGSPARSATHRRAWLMPPAGLSPPVIIACTHDGKWPSGIQAATHCTSGNLHELRSRPRPIVWRRRPGGRRSRRMRAVIQTATLPLGAGQVTGPSRRRGPSRERRHPPPAADGGPAALWRAGKFSAF